MCKVTVVIPNYNGEKYLIPCLESLYENTKIKMRVIVVDNGSKDDSLLIAKEQYPQTEMICLDKNYGFCRAVNEGIKASDTEYVLLLNNDTLIRKGFVEALLQRIEKNEKIFSVEAKMIQYQDDSIIDSAGTYYNALGWAFARGKDQSVEKYNRCVQTFAACAGAAIYCRRVFDEIGLFDEKHFAYLEDIDIGYRAKLYGYVNLYEPKAEVIHVGSATSGSRYNEFKVKYSSRNNIYLIYKNMPMWQIVVNLPFFLTGFGTKAMFFAKKGFGKIYLNGLLDGMRMCEKDYKQHTKKVNWKQCLKIQWELWVNVVRRFSDTVERE